MRAWLEIGSDPVWWLEPSSALPEAEVVAERIRRGGHSKVVALVGYLDDAEASAIARRLPYGYPGAGIEEIVFCRTGPATGAVVEFEPDAWPGEDRTFVADDLDAAFNLVLRFAVEYGAERSIVLVTGGSDFLAAVAELAGGEPTQSEAMPAGAQDPGPFFHGTKADLRPGELLEAGRDSNYGGRKQANYVYLTATMDAAIWGAELAVGESPGRVYQVEPTGAFEDDPNLTDQKFPGNPTRSFRTQQPLRVVGEILDWKGHAPDVLQAMRDHLEELERLGVEAIND